MYDLLEILNLILTRMSQLFIDSSKAKIDSFVDEFERLTDDELRRRVAQARSGELKLEDKRQSPLLKLWRFIFHLQDVDIKTVYQVALGVEAFRRAPADLENTRLYPQQISAAIALTQRCVIQMDTGEGKTYAILPAAFSLMCKYGQVYIVCANSYLAHRDASRTQRYWSYLNLGVGLGLSSSNKENWNQPVIYTTSESLLGRYSQNLLRNTKPEYPVNFNAAIIDEVDTVLIDDAGRSFSIHQGIKSNLFDWRNALDFAETLRGEDLDINRVDLHASLTSVGLDKLNQWLSEKDYQSVSFGSRQQFRWAVEIAFVATRVVEKDKHYIETAEDIFPVNMVTGKINYDSYPSWLVPLQLARKGVQMNDRINRTTVEHVVFTRKFTHLSGISGSVSDDSMEYFMTYWLPVIIIKPRKPRHQGLRNDLVYRTKREAQAGLLEETNEALKSGRPVLIGTQNVEDAEQTYRLLKRSRDLPTGTQLNLITAKNQNHIAASFQHSGEVGVVTIATQLAGRGVDIRLSDSALANGGLSIFGLERSREMRYDRQFLGRAGRQGEPYDAVYFVSLDDEIMKMFASERISAWMGRAGHQEGDVVQASVVTKSLLNAQRKIRKHHFFVRRTKDLQFKVKQEIHDRYTSLVRYVQSPAENLRSCPPALIDYSIQSFLEYNFTRLKDSTKVLNYEQAGEIASTVNELISEDNDIIDITDLEGREERVAFEKISARIQKAIEFRKTEYDTLREEAIAFVKQQNNLSRLLWRLTHFTSLVIDQENNRNSEHFLNFKSSSVEPNPEKTIIVTSDEEMESIFTRFLAIDSVKFEDNEALLQELNNYTSVISRRNREVLVLFGEKIIQIIQEAKTKLRLIEEDSDLTFKNKRIESNKVIQRNPNQIALWSLSKIWLEFINFRIQRIRTGAQVQSVNNIEFQRLLSEKLLDAWEEEEKNFPAYLLFNLLQQNKPQQLDDLFHYQDNEVKLKSKFDPNEVMVREWDAETNFQESSLHPSFDPSKKDKKILANFVAQIDTEDLPQGYSVRALSFALENFLRLSPINTLDGPDKIQSAIKNYYEWEAKDAGIATQYKKHHHKWLKKFIIYLNSRGLIGVLPTLGSRVKSSLRRLWKNLREARTAMQLFQVVYFVLAFILLSSLGDWGNAKPATGILYHLDNLLAGGLFGRGVVFAPVFMSLIIGAVFSYTRHNKVIHQIILSVLTIWVLDWHISSTWFSTVAINILIFGLVYWIGIFAYRLSETLDRTYNLSLLAGWLLYCSFFTFLPNTEITIVSVMAGLAFLIIQYLWRYHFNYIEFSLATNVRIGSTSSMTFETMASRRKIEGFSGAVQHFYAIIGSGVAYVLIKVIDQVLEINISTSLYFLLPSAIYIIISLAISYNLTDAIFSHLRWRNKLQTSGQAIVETNASGEITQYVDLEDFLSTNKRLTFFRSGVLQLLVFGVFSALFYNKFLIYTSFPLPLVYTFISFLIFSLGSNLIRKIYNTFLIRLPINYEPMDFSEIPEPETEPTLLGRIKKIMEPGSVVASVLRVVYIVFIVLYFSYLIYFKIYPPEG